MTEHLFVYGTLRSDAPGPHHQRLLAGRARLVGRGHLPGRLYRVGWYPALLEPESETQRVVGEVYRLPPERAPLIRDLDEFEQAHPSDADAEYRRVVRPVTLEAGRVVEAMVYLYARPLPISARLIQTGDFTR